MAPAEKLGEVSTVTAPDVHHDLVARRCRKVEHALRQVDARLLLGVDRLAGTQVACAPVLLAQEVNGIPPDAGTLPCHAALG
jgi:hypothetical protein